MNSRGLKHFLRELCDGKTDVDSKLRSELFKIRKVFSERKLSMHDRKKYLLKLSFITLSDIPVDIGYQQVCELLEDRRVSAKRAGWLAAVTLFKGQRIAGLLPYIKSGLSDTTNDVSVCLTLDGISAAVDTATADVVGSLVAEVAVHPNSSQNVRKKALLVLAGFYQRSQKLAYVDIVTPRLPEYLSHASPSVGMCAVAIVQAILVQQPVLACDVFPVVLEELRAMIVTGKRERVPMLVHKLMTVAWKPQATADERAMMDEICGGILRECEHTMTYQQELDFFVMFAEVVTLVKSTPVDEDIRQDVVKILLDRIDHHNEEFGEVIAQYALRMLKNLVDVMPQCIKQIKASATMERIFRIMNEMDAVTGELALRLLYATADVDDGLSVLNDLQALLMGRPNRMKVSMVDTCIGLTLRYGKDDIECIDVIFDLLNKFGCGSWFGLAGRVGKSTKAQVYLLEKIDQCFDHADCPEPVMQLAVYSTGEFAFKKADGIVTRLIDIFDDMTSRSQAMTISALAKLAVRFKEIRQTVLAFFNMNVRSEVVDISQRCHEYSRILTMPEDVIKLCINGWDKSTDSVSEPDRNPCTLFETDTWSIRINVNLSQPEAIVVMTMKAITRIAIKQFQILSPDTLKYEAGKLSRQVPTHIEPHVPLNINVKFIATGIFAKKPIIRIAVDEDDVVEVPIPVLLVEWIQEGTANETVFLTLWRRLRDKGFYRMVDLIPPDGDIAEETIRIAHAIFGLRPVRFPMPENKIAMHGVFKRYENEFDVLLIFELKGMDLRLDIRTESTSGLRTLAQLARDAFT